MPDLEARKSHNPLIQDPFSDTETALSKARQSYQRVENEAKRQHFQRTMEKLTSSNTKPIDWWWAVKRLQDTETHSNNPTIKVVWNSLPEHVVGNIEADSTPIFVKRTNKFLKRTSVVTR